MAPPRDLVSACPPSILDDTRLVAARAEINPLILQAALLLRTRQGARDLLYPVYHSDQATSTRRLRLFTDASPSSAQQAGNDSTRDHLTIALNVSVLFTAWAVARCCRSELRAGVSALWCKPQHRQRLRNRPLLPLNANGSVSTKHCTETDTIETHDKRYSRNAVLQSDSPPERSKASCTRTVSCEPPA